MTADGPGSDPDSIEAALRTNYSRTGAAVMQVLYTDAYLSMGGPASTDALAAAAGVAASDHVLDIGCGVGGPAVRLAKTLGCRVTGIDLVESNIDSSRELAADAGVSELTRFVEANAVELPFDAGEFDVVWGQDAWCHVPDKSALLVECARVIRPGGTLAFTDWLSGRGMSDTDRTEALAAALSPSAVTRDGYVALMEANGFEVIEASDISSDFCNQYREICGRLDRRREEVVAQFSGRVFDIVASMNKTILGGFEGGGIDGGRFIARAR